MLVNDYIAKISKFVEEFAEASVAIDDGELSLIAMNGLDQTYDPFVTDQIAHGDDISFATLLGLLHAYVSSSANNFYTRNCIHESCA